MRPPSKTDLESDLGLISSDLIVELKRWLSHLGSERRLSPKTLEAYERDVRQCLTFLSEHLGKKISLGVFSKLAPADVRAFMAMRRADGVASRSLMRALAGLRSFAKFLEREGRGRVGALAAVRAPKIGKTLPKPLAIESACRVADADLRAGEDREPWVLARDAAVMALLYGSGLRISEALGLKRREVPEPGRGDVLVVLGKGGKMRMVPVLQNVLALIADYVAICPYDLHGGWSDLRRRQGRPAEPAHRAARDGAGTWRIGPARDGNAARAAPFLRDTLAGARRRSPCHPGIARPRLALDNADLHRRRHGAAVEGLSLRASAGVTSRRFT